MDKKVVQRKLRQKRVRAKVEGTSLRPRLSIFKSLNKIYAQIINDEKGETLVSSSNLKKKMTAKEVGLDLAKKAQDKKIKKVVFDKGGFKYHGQIKDLADGAREGGLDF
jgi:large subunit ribosomal protein L18